jgi:hypothetical protein
MAQAEELSLAEKIYRDPYGQMSILRTLIKRTPLDNDERKYGYTIDTCKYPSYADDLQKGSDKDFIAEFRLITQHYYRFAAAITEAGYPKEVWKTYLDEWLTARIDEIRRRRAGQIAFDPWASRAQTLGFEYRLVQALNQYRARYNPSLMEFHSMSKDACGYDWIGYVQLRSNPADAVFRLIGEFYFSYCQATDIPPYSARCTKWSSIGQNQNIPEGAYYYMARWPDGGTECGRVNLLYPRRREPEEVGIITIRKSGQECQR